uniref:LamG domain protein jellyroll fold domain protein n=1 Tax=Cyanothece sp. (strain PCC 7425 / ATCC 29141) TaxID=395961 RepID=B8HTY6_CYAP4
MLPQESTIKNIRKSPLLQESNTAATMSEQMQNILVFANDHQGIAAGKGALAQGPFTIEAWVYLTNPATETQIIFAEGTALLYLESGELKFRANSSVEPITSVGAELLPDQWYHLAISRRSRRPGDTKLYINSEQNDNQISVPAITTIGHTYLATHPERSNCGLQGKLLEVRVWRHARSHSEIQANMMYFLSGRELGLVRCWSLTEGMGTVIADKTLNRVQGKVLGDATWESSTVPVQVNTNRSTHLCHATGMEDYGYWFKEISQWQKDVSQNDRPYLRGRIWG